MFGQCNYVSTPALARPSASSRATTRVPTGVPSPVRHQHANSTNHLSDQQGSLFRVRFRRWSLLLFHRQIRRPPVTKSSRGLREQNKRGSSKTHTRHPRRTLRTRVLARTTNMAAGQKLYPRATVKKIVKAHSKCNVSKNVDVMVCSDSYPSNHPLASES